MISQWSLCDMIRDLIGTLVCRSVPGKQTTMMVMTTWRSELGHPVPPPVFDDSGRVWQRISFTTNYLASLWS